MSIIHLINNKGTSTISLEESIKILDNLDEISLDTETTGLDPHTKKLLLLQLGNYDVQLLYDIESFNYKIPEQLKKFLNTTKSLFIIQNAKFDLKFLFKQGVIIKKVFDTFLAETIITIGEKFYEKSLKALAEKYCNVTLDKTVRGKIIKDGLTDEVLLYGANDIKYLQQIKERQVQTAKKLNLINAINLDNNFVIVLAYVEFCGIKLDYNKWRIKVNNDLQILKNAESKLNSYVIENGYKVCAQHNLFSTELDVEINWASPQQVTKIFNFFGINTTVTEHGEIKYSISKNVLESQARDFELVRLYLEYKKAETNVTKFGYKWKEYINPVTGRIHTSYKQILNTGRISSGDRNDNAPNLQNLSSDNLTRSCFIPENGNLLIDADYHAQEQIILANFSQEPNLLRFYERGFTDIHSYVTFLMYPEVRRCSLEDLTPKELDYIKETFPQLRKKAKSAGFAINYGGNGLTIAARCNISKDEGEYVYITYFHAFQKLKEYFDYVTSKTLNSGYITFNNITGRKFFFNIKENPYYQYKETHNEKLRRSADQIRSQIARYSQNYPIQGTAADITKFAGILLFKQILDHNLFNVVKIINLVHDEILIEVPQEMSEEWKEILINCMEKAGNLFCKILPLHAEALIGNYWIH
jgi:DNA polymerase-1